MQVASTKLDLDQAESELNIGRSKLKECDTQINSLSKEQQKLQQLLSDSNVERKKMENEVLMGCDLWCIILLYN
jgi:structural maintenance of chromosome 2